jgi:hypothetical protein
MKMIGKMSLEKIADELINKWNANEEKIKFLLNGKYESRLQEMLYRSQIGDDIEWLYV